MIPIAIGALLAKLGTWGRKAVEVVKDTLPFLAGLAGKTSELHPLESTSSARAVEEWAAVLESCKQQAKEEIVLPAVAEVERELKAFTKKIDESLEKNETLLIQYHIKTVFLKRDLQAQISRLQDNMDQVINQEIAFSNPACREIISMPQGKRRDFEMRALMRNALFHAMEQYAKSFREILESNMKDLRADVLDAMAAAELHAREKKEALEQISGDPSGAETRRVGKETVAKLAAYEQCKKLLEGADGTLE